MKGYWNIRFTEHMGKNFFYFGSDNQETIERYAHLMGAKFGRVTVNPLYVQYGMGKFSTQLVL